MFCFPPSHTSLLTNNSRNGCTTTKSLLYDLGMMHVFSKFRYPRWPLADRQPFHNNHCSEYIFCLRTYLRTMEVRSFYATLSCYIMLCYFATFWSSFSPYCRISNWGNNGWLETILLLRKHILPWYSKTKRGVLLKIHYYAIFLVYFNLILLEFKLGQKWMVGSY